MNPPPDAAAARVAIVTGGSRGIGRATVNRLVTRGYAVLVNDAPTSARAVTVDSAGTRSEDDRSATVETIEPEAAIGRTDEADHSAGSDESERRGADQARSWATRSRRSKRATT